MLPKGTDPFYREILSAGHGWYVRIEVWSGSGQPLDAFIREGRRGEPEGGLAFFSGSVRATLTSRVARQLDLTVPYDMYPLRETDLLAPFGNEIRAYAGVSLGDGSDKYTWPVFRGKIRQVRQDPGGTSVYCADRANDVLDVAFPRPENSQAGNSLVAEFQRIVSDAVPDAEFGLSDDFIQRVPVLTWEFDRGSALDELATSGAGLWYPLAGGEYVIRRIPWTQPQTPVVTLTDGPGGIVNSWSRQRDRDSIFNVVTVAGERLNGDLPVYATASDTLPSSSTFIGGNFGIKSTVERLQTPASQGSAQTAANALLRSYISPVEEWTLQMIPDASLELGDPVGLDIEGTQVTQVVSAFDLPLDLSGDMTVSTRSLVVGFSS